MPPPPNFSAENALLRECALLAPSEALRRLGGSEAGLGEEEVAARLEREGPNELAQARREPWFLQLIKTCRNPLDILLLSLAVVSYFTEDHRAAVVIALIVGVSVALRFFQQARSDSAVAKLKSMIRVTATVLREGKAREVPLRELVPGDVIRLSAGDLIPADVRILSAKDLFLNQSSFTGESFPVEKFETPSTGDKSLREMSSVCFMGTNVESGTATALVVVTGARTCLGGMAKSLARQEVVTSFDQGINRFTWLMIRLMLVLAPLVFLINWATKGNWYEAAFFATAVAVGLTPEMLPMIVTVCLSKGALTMSRRKVIVKRLHSIQNLGGMDVLCTDKTGTLTLDRVILEKHCDVVQRDNEDVFRLAFLNSHFQTGLRNVLDRAILSHREEVSVSGCSKVDEIPFDFSRRIMSVVVDLEDGRRRLIAKGGPEAIQQRCTRFELDGEVLPIEPILVQDLREEFHDLSSDGFRVLAIAYRDVERKAAYSKEDESDLVLMGYVAFLDPPKESAAEAIAALRRHGVTVKVLTGDNELVTRKICAEVGLEVGRQVLGADVDKISDPELEAAAERTTLFARLSPGHKQRVIEALRRKGHVVGFLGDGINDAPALKAADVGISVDTAVDVAKESADVILLEKSLLVLEDGVIEGRKVFANILKYIKMGASSNFGNMFSVVGASAFLPFLPMKPLQVLANNLLYDLSQVAIPTDDVDPEFIAKPRPWSTEEIRRFILRIGPISSIFDYATFFLMLYAFGCWDVSRASLFQTGWFVESLMTQTLIIHVIRTNRVPFLQSRASWPLLITTAFIMGVAAWLPRSPFAGALGFERLPALYWPCLAAILGGYLALTQLVKSRLLGRMGLG